MPRVGGVRDESALLFQRSRQQAVRPRNGRAGRFDTVIAGTVIARACALSIPHDKSRINETVGSTFSKTLLVRDDRAEIGRGASLDNYDPREFRSPLLRPQS